MQDEARSQWGWTGELEPRNGVLVEGGGHRKGPSLSGDASLGLAHSEWDVERREGDRSHWKMALAAG